MSKRTLDYYTKLGLITCERSETNYRYYNKEVLEDLKFIDSCKKMNMSLDEIKHKISNIKSNEIKQDDIMYQIELIGSKMDYLKEDLKEIYSMIQRLEEEEKKNLANKLSPHSQGLLKSILLFSI